MEESEKVYIASKYVGKGYSYEDMCYGDDCYDLKGEEGSRIKDEIGDYMTELRDIGRTAFYEKYKHFNLY